MWEPAVRRTQNVRDQSLLVGNLVLIINLDFLSEVYRTKKSIAMKAYTGL